MKIRLNKGLYATVDAKDYQRCMEGLQWYAWATYHKNRSGNPVRTYYVVRNVVKKDGSRTVQYMHRFILGLTNPKVQADHKDGNGLNNHRKNLRKSTNLQNSHNLKHLSSRSTSGVTGVYRDKNNNKWVAEIVTDGEYKFLGRFSSLRDAKEARQKAERERGRN
jgi:dolichyl-phosphate-mannose--protein O-mannosyl transferase